eukprot:1820149-Heterocapsa_arctica.AAC.1
MEIGVSMLGDRVQTFERHRRKRIGDIEVASRLRNPSRGKPGSTDLLDGDCLLPSPSGNAPKCT